jgi:DNA-binding response OmpR family regulator
MKPLPDQEPPTVVRNRPGDAKHAVQMRVLIVEDNVHVAGIIITAFKAAGHQVVGHGQSLADSLRLVSLADFDAAILDIDLKGLNSGPVAAELRRRKIPFVVLTGSAQFLARAHQGAPLVLKPFKIDRLLRIVGSIDGRPQGDPIATAPQKGVPALS